MKYITLKVFAAVCILTVPALAGAATQYVGNGVNPTTGNPNPTTSYTIGSQVIKPSNNVTIGIISNTATYAAKSGHTKGDRAFGTNSVESKIYYFDTGVNNAVGSTTCTNSNDVYTAAGWSAL